MPSSTGDQALFTLANATYSYGGHHSVLDDVDLTVERGDFLGIVGPSGAGKTTLLRALMGSMNPIRGTCDRTPDLRVGYVPQVESVSWDFPITVGQAVLMGRTKGRTLPWRSKEEHGEICFLLEHLGLGGLENRQIRQLSGGQQQRMFIARALFNKPHVLLLDEPTSGVDIKTRHDILHLLGDLNSDGVTIVLTTHDLNGIAAHLPTLVCVNGRVIDAGVPTHVLRPEVLEKTFGAPMDVLIHGGLPVIVDRRMENPLRTVTTQVDSEASQAS
jgi:zinc/manganese transport system ATP-binding protein